jgi:hypothetical protein
MEHLSVYLQALFLYLLNSSGKYIKRLTVHQIMGTIHYKSRSSGNNKFEF